MVFLIIVAGLLYVVLKFIRKKKTPSIEDVDFIQNLASLDLSGGSTLEIVEIGEKIYLLGVGNSSVNLLTEIEDKELIFKLKSRPTAPKHKSFMSVLGKVFEKKGQNIKIEPQKGFLGFLKEQKDRLKKMK